MRKSLLILALSILIVSATSLADWRYPRATYCSPEIATQIRKAWVTSSDGYDSHEACFTIENNKISPITRGDEPYKCPVYVYKDTQAIFHTHPIDSISWPSPNDKDIARRTGVMMYVISRDGLIEYDPKTHIEKLVECTE